MKKIIFFSFLLYLNIYASCKGKDGAIGPAGPQGVTGATGAQGQMGLTGATGNANVKVRIFNAPPSAWTLTSSTVISNYYESYASVPEITQAIHDKGFVLAFISEGSDQTIWQGMPYLQVFKASPTVTYTSTYRFSSRVGSVAFTKQDSDGTTPGLPSLRFVKVVIIEGTGALPPNVDPNNYAAVAKYLNLAL